MKVVLYLHIDACILFKVTVFELSKIFANRKRLHRGGQRRVAYHLPGLSWRSLQILRPRWSML